MQQRKVVPEVDALAVDAQASRGPAQQKQPPLQRPQRSWFSKLGRLHTKEDRHLVHKSLGILAVLSFVLRYGYCSWTQGSLGFSQPTASAFDWATMGVHLALSCSSLLFHVLPMRIIKRPMMIWEEYRLHAIVFSLRCASVFVFGQVRPWAGTFAEQAALTAVVLAHHVAADEVTRRWGSARHTTVRINGDTRPLSTAVLRFYSLYQFAALGSHLVPGAHLSAMGWNTMIAIQSSAFLMTLFRKALISWHVHGIVYTLCLMASISHMVVVLPHSPLFVVLVLAAFVARTQFRVNKYVIWTLFCLAHSPRIHSHLVMGWKTLDATALHVMPSRSLLWR